MTPKPASDLPELPEPSFRLYYHNRRDEYSVSKADIGDTYCYTPEDVRAIQEAAFNAGRAEGGKDAASVSVFAPPSDSALLKAFSRANNGKQLVGQERTKFLYYARIGVDTDRDRAAISQEPN